MTNTSNPSKRLSAEAIEALQQSVEQFPGIWTATRVRGTGVTQAGIIGLNLAGLGALTGGVGGFKQIILNESGLLVRQRLHAAHCIGCGIALYRSAPHTDDCKQVVR